MTTKLYTTTQDGKVSSWWRHICEEANKGATDFADYNLKRDAIYSQYNATFVNVDYSDSSSFIQFQSEEDVTLFLLKFS